MEGRKIEPLEINVIAPIESDESSIEGVLLNPTTESEEPIVKSSSDEEEKIDETSSLSDVMNEAITQAKEVPIEELRLMKDYKEALAAQDHLFMGRAFDTKVYKKKFPGRILHPERRGEIWTLKKNMAFMAGAIESGKKFLIVSSADRIATRARRGLDGEIFTDGQLGFASAEMLWLDDNGYQFVPDADRYHVWAIPPKETVSSARMRRYGLIDDVDVVEQVERVEKIAKEVTELKARHTVSHPPIQTWGSNSNGYSRNTGLFSKYSTETKTPWRRSSSQTSSSTLSSSRSSSQTWESNRGGYNTGWFSKYSTETKTPWRRSSSQTSSSTSSGSRSLSDTTKLREDATNRDGRSNNRSWGRGCS